MKPCQQGMGLTESGQEGCVPGPSVKSPVLQNLIRTKGRILNVR